MDTRPPPNKNRLPLYIGLGVAGIAGYYLYTAGGSPKVAKKEVERRFTDEKGGSLDIWLTHGRAIGDAARISSTVKSELPGRGKVYQKEGEELAQRAGAKLDHTVNDFDNVVGSCLHELTSNCPCAIRSTRQSQR